MSRASQVALLVLLALTSGAYAAPQASAPGRERLLLSKAPLHLGDDTARPAGTWRTTFQLTPADLRGRTGATLTFLLRTAEAQHAPRLTLNRVSIDVPRTGTQTWRSASCDVPVGALRAAANTLEIAAPAGESGLVECDLMEVTLLLSSQVAHFPAPTEGFNPPPPGTKKGFGGPWYRGRVHTGVDVNWGNATRLPVHAIAEGTVRYAGPVGEGWGNGVIIEHPGPPAVIAVCAHIIIDPAIGQVKFGAEGPHVRAGQVIGVIDPGLVRAVPHLHFGLFAGDMRGFTMVGWGSLPPRDFPGRWVNPADYLAR